MPGPAAALAAAVWAGDAARVEDVLALHPELRATLDQPLPGEAFGATPLIRAALRGSREVVEVLLRAGADINARSHWWAGGFGVLEHEHALASFLIERGATVDVHAASRLGMLDRLRELLDADPALVHARGGDGKTPLHVAATVEIARLLLERGADMDALDVDHESTPAQYLVRERPDVARLLVARGCRTDLLLASALGDLERVRRHLDADPECIRARVGPRHFPMRDPRAGGIIYIWTLGQGKSAHFVAREFGHEEIFRLLLERSPVDLRFRVACETGDQAGVEALLAAEPGLTGAIPAELQEALADAARNGNAAAVRLMLASGWPAGASGEQGETPLHWAAWRGDAEMVREILRHRPPLEARDDDHHATPLGWAVYGSIHGWHPERGDYAGAVAALLEAGARLPRPLEEIEATEAVLEVLRRDRGGA